MPVFVQHVNPAMVDGAGSAYHDEQLVGVHIQIEKLVGIFALVDARARPVFNRIAPHAVEIRAEIRIFFVAAETRRSAVRVDAFDACPPRFGENAVNSLIERADDHVLGGCVGKENLVFRRRKPDFCVAKAADGLHEFALLRIKNPDAAAEQDDLMVVEEGRESVARLFALHIGVDLHCAVGGAVCIRARRALLLHYRLQFLQKLLGIKRHVSSPRPYYITFAFSAQESAENALFLFFPV